MGEEENKEEDAAPGESVVEENQGLEEKEV